MTKHEWTAWTDEGHGLMRRCHNHLTADGQYLDWPHYQRKQFGIPYPEVLTPILLLVEFFVVFGIIIVIKEELGL